ncbi:MAG: nuclear transport factor 2 family protein [Chloroflexi bacterium]|nr:nuclear transport factor 2 family protein [Chloroflexota bacterium]
MTTARSTTTAGETATQAVREAIEQFRTAVQARDIQALSRVVAHEDNIVFYGSQAGDKQVGWDAVRRSFEEQFSEVSGLQAEVRDSTISVVGDLAWAAYDLRYTEVGGSEASSFDTRWTCVLRRYGDGWKFVHMHHSVGR